MKNAGRDTPAKRVGRKLPSPELDGAENLLRELEASRAKLEKVERFQKETLARLGRELTGPVSASLLTLESLSQLRPSLRKIKLYKLARTRLIELQELIENLLLFAVRRRRQRAQRTETGDESYENSSNAME